MSSQSLATWTTALKVAGTSDARQIRQVLDGQNPMFYDRFAFCALLGGQEYSTSGNDISKKSVVAKIGSKAVKTLTPEIYDFEAAPNAFRLASNSSALAVGDSATLTFEKTNGMIAGTILYSVNQGTTLRVTSVPSSTTAVVSVLKIDSGDANVTLAADANIAYFEKLGSANVDGVTIGNGSNQEPINRSNNLQFMIEPLAQGFLQKNLALYGTGGAAEFQQEKMRKMFDMQRQREAQFVAGRKTSTGSGANRVFTADGLTGLAASVYNNTATDGALSYDDFARGLMPQLRQGGGSMEVFALCGNEVLATLSSYSQVQTRTKSAEDKYSANIQTLETPAGILHLIPHAMLDTDARRGQMIAFQPNFLTRAYLEGVDLQYMEGLNIGNELVDRSAIMVCEGLMASNPKAITIATNILK